MPLESFRTTTREFYGQEYTVARLRSGLKLFVPSDREAEVHDELVDALDESFAEQNGFFDEGIPLNFGYQWHSRYYPGHDRSNIYKNDDRQDYLKHPVSDKHGVMQSVAMTAISRALGTDGPLRAIGSSAALYMPKTSVSLAFYDGAEGYSLRSILNVHGRFQDQEHLEIKNETTRILKDYDRSMVPRSLRPLVNDYPPRHGFRMSNGVQNVFVKHPENPTISIDELREAILNGKSYELVYTLIDQGHPDASASARHGLEIGRSAYKGWRDKITN